jgi:hypothetical protein
LNVYNGYYKSGGDRGSGASEYFLELASEEEKER